MPNFQLNHISLCIKEPSKSSKFYVDLFGILGLKVEPRGVGENIIILSQKGASIGLKKSERSGSRKGVDHFGFTTDSKDDLEMIAKKLEVRKITYERKKHRDGSESIFLNDPDGYKMQIVYMPPDMYLN